ncbi:MAG: hypothetical protein K8M05_34945, partial [Deltaproteobacteria bacterium]|nr:hypothetical protein [Kofleriaceae bacterium]
LAEGLGLLAALPGWAVHLLLAVGAAVENLIPPIPADTFVVVAGLLSARGVVDPLLAGLLTWGANVAGALLVRARADGQRAAGGFLLHLHCPITDAYHLGFGHGGAVVAGAVLGALLVPILAKERSR